MRFTMLLTKGADRVFYFEEGREKRQGFRKDLAEDEGSEDA